MDGLPCVFRKSKRWDPVCEGEGFKLLNLREGKDLVFALTDNWTAKGTPRLWGFETVLCRIRELDAWEHQDLLEKIDAENTKVDESNRRALKNEMEAFWSHNRDRFKEAFKDTLTHGLSKDEPRKRLEDRSIKNGNR